MLQAQNMVPLSLGKNVYANGPDTASGEALVKSHLVHAASLAILKTVWLPVVKRRVILSPGATA